ncbi:DUF2752 domain-containing protein [Nocardioides insulae]|uniref:DUF2752 domain-containing protein n=1 Tax=Nocardioides insulae TaxID=394734 RepID=UPI00040FAF4C|nr:DUF2752 domain-containing protein [Nocardioides insulae]
MSTSHDRIAASGTRRRDLLLFGAVTAAGLVAATALVTADPHEPGHYPTCPFLAMTGLFCPGCGSLRALNSLLTLDPVGAFGRNPLAVALLPLVLLAWVGWGLRLIGHPFGVRLHPTRVPAALIWALFAVVLVFGVLRNLPGWDFLSPN